MTSLPTALVWYRTDLEEAIARELTVRLRQSKRRRRVGVALVAAILLVGTASALAARELLSDDPYSARGTISRTVDGVDFSFTVPTHKRPYYEPDLDWWNGPIERAGDTPDTARPLNFLISASVLGGQAAEAVFFWTAFGYGSEVAPCLHGPAGRSTADLATALARQPGTQLIRRPTRTTIGGRPAMHLVVRVREDIGCDPGYFFTWRDQRWGTFWSDAGAGDTIRVWIVDVDGKRLVFQAETKYPGPRGPAAELVRAYRAEFKQVDRDVTKIVASIRFD